MIQGYKVWGDFSDTEGSTTPTDEPADYTAWGSGSVKKIEDLYLTATDGNKSVLGKAKLSVGTLADTVATKADLPSTATDGDKYKVTADESKEGKATCYQWNGAWNFYGYLSADDSYAEKPLETVLTHHSSSQPVVTLATDKAIISDKEEHDAATLTATFASSCGISEYKVVAYESQSDATAGTSADPTNVDLYGTEEKAASSTWTPELLESKLVSAIPGEGAKYIVVYAKNLCGKWGKSNTLTITVDLTAPIGNITVDSFYNAPKGLTASASDGSGVAKMTAWIDTSAATVTPPETATEVDYHENPLVGEVDWTGAAEGDIYAHILFEDTVGNKTVVTSAKAVYDITPPTGCSISIPSITNTPSVVATLTASDSVSGVSKVKIFGDIVGSETADWQDYASSVNVTLTNGDGSKTVKALFKDNAGNVIAEAVTATTVLDATAPAPVLSLWNNADTEALGTVTGVRDIRVHIGATEDIANITAFKLWGDVTDATSEPADWSDFAPESGKNYKSVAIQLTTGDGAKTINVKIKDEAGNVGTATATITLNTQAPEITVSDVDYTQISLSDEQRFTAAAGKIAGTKSSELTFKFTPDIKLAKFKVCIYDASKTAATAEAIEESKSINMTGTNVEGGSTVACTLSSTDFKEHSVIKAQSGDDKIGYVIVVGKSEAGIWSAYAMSETMIANM